MFDSGYESKGLDRQSQVRGDDLYKASSPFHLTMQFHFSYEKVMKRTSWLLLLLARNLIASDIPEIDFGLGPGYQYDHIRSTISGPNSLTDSGHTLYTEDCDPLHSILIAGFANLKAKALQVQLMGTFGWIVAGDMDISATLFTDVTEPSRTGFYKASPAGEVASAYGNIGYQIDLWHCESHRIISLTPLFGFGYDQQWYRRRNLKTNPFLLFDVQPFGSRLDLTLTVARQVTKIWMGPYIGVSLTFQPVRKFWFSMMYDYHWLSFLEKTSFNLEGRFLSPFGVSDLTDLVNPIRNSTLQARGHKGWLRARYEINGHWNIDLLASLLYYSTHNATSFLTVRRLSQFFSIDQTFDLGSQYKARWTSFSIILNPSYAF